MDISHEQVITYDPAWTDAYTAEAEKLKSVFNDSLLTIEHIGSTSVPELASKPIIDIAVVIEKHEDADSFIEPLKQLGYLYDQPASSNERHFFRKGDPTRYHLSVCYQSRGSFLKRQILFRDWLRSHPEDRDTYEKLKLQLIEQDPSGTNTYISGKSDLIQEILKKAGM